MNQNEQNQKEKLLMVNKYSIAVSFLASGIKVSDRPQKENETIKQRKVTFTEISNYFENRFPGRLLTIKMRLEEITKLYASRTKVDDRSMFDVDVIITPVETGSGVAHLMPLSGGKYKAVLRDNESINNFLTVHNNDSVVEQNMDLGTVVNFILFRENELDFSLNPNINFLYKNNNLSTMFCHMLQSSSPNSKIVLSKFDHDPMIPQFLIQRTGLQDAIELLDDEFGFYKTDYTLFMEDDILYFLNKDNDANVKVKALDYEILLDVNRYTGMDNGMRYKQDVTSSKILRTKVNVDKIKINVNNTKVLENEPMYILPNGDMTFNKNSSSRNVDVVKKITNVPHVKKAKNTQIEYIDLDLSDVSFINVNPLTKVTYVDSTNSIRNYRVCFKYTSVESNIKSKTTLRAFRVITK